MRFLSVILLFLVSAEAKSCPMSKHRLMQLATGFSTRVAPCEIQALAEVCFKSIRHKTTKNNAWKLCLSMLSTQTNAKRFVARAVSKYRSVREWPLF